MLRRPLLNMRIEDLQAHPATHAPDRRGGAGDNRGSTARRKLIASPPWARPRELPHRTDGSRCPPQPSPRRRRARRRSRMAPRLCRVGDHAALRSGVPPLRLPRRPRATRRAVHRRGAGPREADGGARGETRDAHRRRGLPPRGLARDRPRGTRPRHGAVDDHGRARHDARDRTRREGALPSACHRSSIDGLREEDGTTRFVA